MTTRSSDPATSPHPSRAKAWPAGARWRRRAARWSSRDHLLDLARTLAWVVPITILVWVYAERAQQAREEAVPVRIDLENPDPDVRVSMQSPEDGQITVTLLGSRGRLDQVLNRIGGRGGRAKLPVVMDRSATPGREHEIVTTDLLNEQSVFADARVLVSRADPPRVRVFVDPVVSRGVLTTIREQIAARIEPGSLVKPDEVIARGPASLLDDLQRQGRLVAELDLSDLPSTPGVHDLPAVQLRPTPDPRVQWVPQAVRVTLTVKAQEDARHTLQTVPIYVSKPSAWEGLWSVRVDQPVLTGVTVTGPGDAIARIRRPESVPYAVLRVTPDDLNRQGLRRAVVFPTLPAGSRVTDERIEVGFSIVPVGEGND